MTEAMGKMRQQTVKTDCHFLAVLQGQQRNGKLSIAAIVTAHPPSLPPRGYRRFTAEGILGTQGADTNFIRAALYLNRSES